MSGERGDRSVDSSSTTNESHEQVEIADTEEEYPLTFRSLFFWGIVVVLGLLGTCVIVAILLALARGS